MDRRSPGIFALGLVLALAAPVRAAPRDRAPRTAEGAGWYQQVRLGMAHIGQAGYSGESAAVQWLGSGFLVDRECTVATALHILEGIPSDSVVVRFLDPDDADAVRTYATRIVFQDSERDIALLRFGPPRNAKRLCRSDSFRPFPLIEAWDRRALTGESVFVVGFPALEGAPPRDVPIVRRGIVASAELEWEGRSMLLLDLTGVPGFSGAPVILERSGQVIGMIYGPGRTQRRYDLEWATPFSRPEYERGAAAADGNGER